MRILIDIGHPAHVHYFRNFISIMQSKGHEFYITARDKEVVFSLLDYYRLPYVSRGKGGKGLLGKLMYIPKADRFILKAARKFKPDLFLSFASSYAAHAAFLTGRPHIAFDDTDHAIFEHMMYVPFTRAIATPRAFMKDFGKKHVRFDSYMELCSLHPSYFRPDPELLQKSGIAIGEKYAVIRLVSWKASHDIGLSGISNECVRELVRTLSLSGRVIISSESDLADDLKQYQYTFHPAQMHQLLYHAKVFIGESITMSAEASFLGTPALCKSSAIAGVMNEQTSMGLYRLFDDEKELVDRANEIFSDPSGKLKITEFNRKLVSGKIDPTAFMVWFVENYPESFRVMKQNPDYQNTFR